MPRWALVALVTVLSTCAAFPSPLPSLRHAVLLSREARSANRVSASVHGTTMQNVQRPARVASRLTFEGVIEGQGGSKSFPAVAVSRPGAHGTVPKTNQDSFIVSSTPMARHAHSPQPADPLSLAFFCENNMHTVIAQQMGAVMDGHGSNGVCAFHAPAMFRSDCTPRLHAPEFKPPAALSSRLYAVSAHRLTLRCPDLAHFRQGTMCQGTSRRISLRGSRQPSRTRSRTSACWLLRSRRRRSRRRRPWSKR